MNRIVSFPILISFFICGCASSKFTYTPLKENPTIQNSIIVNQSKNVVWKKLIQGLGTNFFVINNLDKESGLINVSYSGDPELYVDGGEIHYYFSNARGERNYTFPASRKFAQYETMVNGKYAALTRNLSLEGRINILVNEIDSLQTSVTVNTKYILTLDIMGQDAVGNPFLPYSEVFSFNTGESIKNKGGAEFRSSGILENSILHLVTK